MSNRVVVKLCDQCEEHWVPRAVVALSEDRQWLVVLVDGGWLIYRDRLTGYLVFGDGGDDTGQGAEDVLAAFLREREA